MEIRAKDIGEDKYIKIDLTKKEIDDLLSNKYPSHFVELDGAFYTVSIGIKK